MWRAVLADWGGRLRCARHMWRRGHQGQSLHGSHSAGCQWRLPGECESRTSLILTEFHRYWILKCDALSIFSSSGEVLRSRSGAAGLHRQQTRWFHHRYPRSRPRRAEALRSGQNACVMFTSFDPSLPERRWKAGVSSSIFAFVLLIIVECFILCGSEWSVCLCLQDAEGFPIDIQITDNGNSTYFCVYIPTKPIKHTVIITWGDVNVPSSPFRVNHSCTLNSESLLWYKCINSG